MTELSQTLEDTVLDAEAQLEDDACRALVTGLERGWLELGVRFANVRKKQLYRRRGFASFSEWMESVGVRRSTGYELAGIAEELSDIPQEELLKFRCKENAKWLMKLAKSQRTSKLIDAAKNMSEKEFSTIVRSKLKGAQVEMLETRVLRLPESLANKFDEVMKLASSVEGTEAFEPRFEAILSTYEMENGYPGTDLRQSRIAIIYSWLKGLSLEDLEVVAGTTVSMMRAAHAQLEGSQYALKKKGKKK